MDKMNTIFSEIDAINEKDPNQELVNDKPLPKELIYGQRMTEMLSEFVDSSSEELQIAARGQHIKRWSIPRSSYPMDRKGYLKWRTELKLMHADLLEVIMKEHQYEQESIKTVKDLILKKGLKTNPDTQTLEDVICLVFLKYQFEDFAKKHNEEKIISIVQKTWGKMSEKGHDAALLLNISEESLALIKRALGA